MSGARGGSFLTMTSVEATLLPVALSAEEGISRPFELQLELSSTEPAIDPTTMLDTEVTVVLNRNGAAQRHFHGVVRAFSAGGPLPRATYGYQASIVPKLWFLSQTEDCRIFENQTPLAVIKLLFTEGGVTEVEYHCTRAATPRDYIVQYNESDLSFIHRLMEESGLFYCFKHEDGGHTLVVADNNTAFAAASSMTFGIDGNGRDPYADLVFWRPSTGTVHGEAATDDYDYVTPSTKLGSQVNTTMKAAGGQARDVFHYPARSTQASEVKIRATDRLEATEAKASLFKGASGCDLLVPGMRFTLSDAASYGDAFSGEGGREFIVHSVSHQATDDIGGWAEAGGASYSNHFTAFPATRSWRQPLATPRPRVHGLQSALVVGSEEIATESLGRVRVRFFWDRLADRSCWCRVIQPWAGDGWGWQFLPRVGSEVAVAFMDGDLDRPVVVGGLYNGEQLPPFPLPAEKTKSGIKTRSSTGGGKADYSELSFDDKIGQELVLLHAQKDLKVTVEHDQTLTVDNCRIKTVKADETVTINGKQEVNIDKGRATYIAKGGDALEVTAGDLTLTNLQANISIAANAGKIELTAAQSITLTVGGNSLKIDQSGITIKGIMVKAEGSAMLDLKAPMTTVKADGMMMVKGGILMLN